MMWFDFDCGVVLGKMIVTGPLGRENEIVSLPSFSWPGSGTVDMMA